MFEEEIIDAIYSWRDRIILVLFLHVSIKQEYMNIEPSETCFLTAPRRMKNKALIIFVHDLRLKIPA